MQIPLFPLHVVLCPGIAMPLHIFEARYRLLTERCLERTSPFGIVLIREGREVGGEDISIAGVGTVAEIREARRLRDGRYELLVVGTGRFAIESVDADSEPYLVGEVVPIPDEVGDPARVVRLGERAMRRFVGYLRALQPLDGETADQIDVQVELDTEPEPDPGSADPAANADPAGKPAAGETETARRLVIPDDPTTLSHLLSGIIQADNLQRQILLEAGTTEERLEALHALLDREMWMLRRRLRHFEPSRDHDAVRRN